MADRREWPAPCWDAMGRERVLWVRETGDGGVVLTLPAGETATLTTSGLAVLWDALRLMQHPLPSGPAEGGAQ